MVRVGLLWKECDELDVERRFLRKERSPFGQEESIEFSETRFEIQRTPLEPGPVETFEVGPDGRLLDISPGPNTMLLSGNGKRIAHPRDRLKGWDMYIGDLDAGTFTSLVRFPPDRYIEDYSMSWEGNRVGMLTQRKGEYRAFVADFEERLLLEILGISGKLAWSYLSRDGRTIVFLQDRQPVIVDLETGAALMPKLPGEGKARFPILSEDGTKISLVIQGMMPVPASERDRDGQEDVLEEREEVAVIDLEKKTLRHLFRLWGGGGFAAPSGDAKRLLCSVYGDNFYSLHLADLERGQLQRISAQLPWSNLYQMVEDGSRVVFAHQHGVWTTDLETGSTRRVWGPPGIQLSWGSVSKDGRRVLVRAADAETGRRTLGVYLLDLERM
jgi:Tol biopolymer transport system component